MVLIVWLFIGISRLDLSLENPKNQKIPGFLHHYWLADEM